MKTFLSIGTGPGIGFETAKRFAGEGFRTVVSSRSAANGEVLTRALGDNAHFRQVDASDPTAVFDLVADTERHFGGIDVVHYNAGNIRNQTLEEQPTDTLVRDLAINLAGAMAAIKSATREMKSRQQGTILLTGGGLALHPHPDYISLSAGKAGLRALGLGLFDSLKSSGIHLGMVTVYVGVSPGSQQVKEIADRMWDLHAQERHDWAAEISFNPGS